MSHQRRGFYPEGWGGLAVPLCIHRHLLEGLRGHCKTLCQSTTTSAATAGSIHRFSKVVVNNIDNAAAGVGAVIRVRRDVTTFDQSFHGSKERA